MPRAAHSISREDISDNALKVLYRLNNGGYSAYLVGGCVRDLMLGLKPKDFDVVTDATPEQIKKLFRNCRLIGRRFRLAHIVFGREIIEVATFRGHHDADAPPAKDKKTALSHQGEQGQLLRDNVFGTIEEDAERRDFTVNAMYYDIADFSVKDFANGQEAIARREIDLIGDPETRYREDPVRMLRAVRFAAKLDFHITPRTEQSIPGLASLLSHVAPARMFEEVIKLFISGAGVATFKEMQRLHLFGELFPSIQPLLVNEQGREYRFLVKVLENTDNRINTGMRVTPAFFYASVLWYVVEERCQQHVFEGGFSHHDAFHLAMNDVLLQQSSRIAIPRRFSSVMRDIWILQQRLPKRFGKRAYQILEHPKFRAAYDFLLVRAEVEGGELVDLAQWWTDFYDADPGKRKDMLAQLRSKSGGPTRRKRAKRKTPKEQ
ncbi:MAG: polynucleotide adenylyltransferase PcnB [Aestuariibacter sp.]